MMAAAPAVSQAEFNSATRLTNHVRCHEGSSVQSNGITVDLESEATKRLRIPMFRHAKHLVYFLLCIDSILDLRHV
jgi:hypothetical protein